MADEIMVNGVPIGAQAPAAGRTIVLPSGKAAAIRKGKGRDLMNAQRAAGEDASALAIAFALIAELASIDGARIVYEDVRELDLEDVLALQAEVMGGNFQLPPPQALPPSSASDLARRS